MIKYKLLILLILLPNIVLSHNERRGRRRPVSENTKHYDQVSLTSDIWPEQLITSSSHTETYQDQGDITHSNYVVTVVPKKQRSIENRYTETLDSTNTAQEYVNKALEYHQKYEGDSSKRIPSSTFSKYNLFENPVQIEIMKESYSTVKPSYQSNQEPPPPQPQPQQHIKSHYQPQKQQYDYHEDQNYHHNPQQQQQKHHQQQQQAQPSQQYSHQQPKKQYYETPIKYSYKTTESPNQDPSPSESNYHHQNSHHNQVSSHHKSPPVMRDYYTSSTQHITQPPPQQHTKHELNKVQYHPNPVVKHHVIKIIEDIQPSPTPTPQLDKTEILTHIERSVLKMFREMERKKKLEDELNSYHKKLESTTSKPINVVHYFSSTRAPPVAQPTQKIIITKAAPTEQYLRETPVIDLTVKHSRHRPKQIDPAALDIGQSWSSGTSFDHSAILKTAQGFDTSNVVPIHHQPRKLHNKPKLHFNQQTYHDINSLPYTVESIKEDLYHKGYSYPEISDMTGYSSASVGATISVGQKNEPEYNVKIINPDEELLPADNKPIHVINGIPMHDPYKVDVKTIRYILGGISQAQAYDNENLQGETSAPNDDDQSQKNWTPYPMTTDPYSKGPNVYPKAPSTSAESLLPYDSYSPKYNNNPKGHGYQESYKTKTPHKTSNQGTSSRKNKKMKNDGTSFDWSNDNLSSFNDDEAIGWNPTNDSRGSSSNKKPRTQRKAKYNSRNTSSNSRKSSRKLPTDLSPPPRYINYK